MMVKFNIKEDFAQVIEVLYMSSTSAVLVMAQWEHIHIRIGTTIPAMASLDSIWYSYIIRFTVKYKLCKSLAIPILLYRWTLLRRGKSSHSRTSA